MTQIHRPEVCFEFPYCLCVNEETFHYFKFTENLFFLCQGMSVFKVTAIDQDTGVNDYILYSIEGRPQSKTWRESWENVLFAVSKQMRNVFIFSTLFDRFDTTWHVYNLKRWWCHIRVDRYWQRNYWWYRYPDYKGTVVFFPLIVSITVSVIRFNVDQSFTFLFYISVL